ncbi:DUF2231 domain-containing protein [Microbacteriaceae bacterium 4G12]
MINEVINHIHPIMVHMPIAMIIIAFLYDVWIAIRNGRLVPSKGIGLWIVAAIGAWLSVATGPEDFARGNTNFLEIHSTLADITSIVASIIVVVRIVLVVKGSQEFLKKALIPYLLLSALSLVLVLSTGYYGGKMVYSDGIGVKVNNTLVNPPK